VPTEAEATVRLPFPFPEEFSFFEVSYALEPTFDQRPVCFLQVERDLAYAYVVLECVCEAAGAGGGN
jgi:hypothetical protein